MLLDKSIERFKHVDAASYRRASNKDLKADNDYVNKKYIYFVELLASRLNQVHNTNHNSEFWKKCLSLGFIRYVTLAHDAFMNFEQHFDHSQHECHLMAKDSYVLPFDFEEQRKLLQYSDLGQEQLFSVYINLFYPGQFPSLALANEHEHVSKQTNSPKYATSYFRGLLTRFKRLTIEKVIIRFHTRQSKHGQMKLGLYGAYFSENNLNKLILKTKGIISVIQEVPRENISRKGKDLEIRRNISQSEIGFDRFDQFFFKSMESLFPSVLLEDFKAASNEIEEHFKPYLNLKYLVCESWMGNTIDSIALAYMRLKSVKHVYNEHNALFYPFTGTMVELRANLVDTYYTMGWEDKKISNLVPGASLFEYSITKNLVKKYPITLISNVRFAKIPEYSSVYGFCAENVSKYASYMKVFYRSLSKSVIGNILYRGPRPGYEAFVSYNNEFLLKPFLSQLNTQDTSNLSGKELIASSGLVIVDYMATSFLESMHMNVPTILLLNKDIYYLKEEHLDFFDGLIEVGICQTDPKVAADFISEMGDDIKQWWENEKVQQAKNIFLETNFGDPEDAIRFYFSLLEKGV